MNISSKFPLYDILAMIIPGGVIMAGIFYFSEYVMVFDKAWIGPKVVNTHISVIQYAALLVGAYILGLLNNCLVEFLFKCRRNKPSHIQKELSKVLDAEANINLHKFVCNKCPNSIRHSYYKAYYALSQAKLLGAVPYLEGQIALLRNLILPLFLLSTSIWYTYGFSIVVLLFYLSIIPMFIVINNRQHKIYNLVWEAVNYYEL